MSVNEFIDIIYNNITTNVAEIIEDTRKVIYEMTIILYHKRFYTRGLLRDIRIS